MKKIIFLSMVFLGPLVALSQENSKIPEIKRNTLYFEAFGQGLYNSFSYDRLYHLEKKTKTSFSAGITLIPHPELFVLAAPISYNFIFGAKNHHLELGIGFTAMYMRHGRVSASETYFDKNGTLQTNDYVGYSNDFYSFLTPKIGYRFQKAEGGMFYRVTITPPLAGINRIGAMKGGSQNNDWSYNEYFTSAAFFGYRAFPWAGLSIGYTLKK